MKIAFLDLNHTTCGVHTNTTPLGSGLIATYLKKNIDHPFDIRLFKNIERVLELKDWIPDVVGLAQYVWNSELNLFGAKHIKKINPNCLVITGGPNQDLDAKKRQSFLMHWKDTIDLCVAYDGETPFMLTIQRMLDNESSYDLKKKPPPGIFCLDPDTHQLIVSPDVPPKIKDLDVFGSVYAEGLFDEFLDDGWHPFVQTHRGCPFLCTFCHTGDTFYNKMFFQSPEVFRKDIEYLAKRYSGQHNVTLYMANTNMSLFNQDFPIAEIIFEMQQKYDWPKIINVNSGKKPEKLKEMFSLIQFRPAIALQTLTEDVLKNIKRKNIPTTAFIDFQKEVLEQSDIVSATELILSLPGETKETFMETLTTVIDSGIQSIDIYTLMNLRGTPEHTDEFIERYGFKIAHRVVPRQLSQIEGEKIIDTEEVVYETSTMSFDDYLELRELSFVVASFLNSSELKPLRTLLMEYEVSTSDWIFSIHKNLLSSTEIFNVCRKFMQETRDELFPSREALLEFYDKPQNFDALSKGLLGDNLLRKYKLILLTDLYGAFVNLGVDQARVLINEKYSGTQINQMLSNLETYLRSRNVKDYLKKEKDEIKQTGELDYDIPSWLAANNRKQRLEDFMGTSVYDISLPEGVEKRFSDIVAMNKDYRLSLQMLLRDGHMKDFWPTWDRQKTAMKSNF
jgi:radical SAM superfamily enzyme YgiQ (UPF0313 family)